MSKGFTEASAGAGILSRSRCATKLRYAPPRRADIAAALRCRKGKRGAARSPRFKTRISAPGNRQVKTAAPFPGRRLSL